MRWLLFAVALFTMPTRSAVAACRADFNSSGAVEINEIIQVVNEALGGCSDAPATPTRRQPTPTRTPTEAPNGCPYRFNDAVSGDRFCGYFGPTTSARCGDLLPSGSSWTTNGTDVYAILVDNTGSVGVIGTRSGPTSAKVDGVSPGPDFDQLFDATGTISLPSNARLTVAFDAGLDCGKLTHTGAFQSLIGDNALRAGRPPRGISEAIAALTKQAAAAGISVDARAAALRRLLGAMENH